MDSLPEEWKVIQSLDTVLMRGSASLMIDMLILNVKQKLVADSKPWTKDIMPLSTYGGGLPESIRSSQIYVLCSQSKTEITRYPNSHTYIIPHRDSGDIKLWTGREWHSHPLTGDPGKKLTDRWLFIPSNTWHQITSLEGNLTIISFHTEEKLTEEHPGMNEADLIRKAGQKK